MSKRLKLLLNIGSADKEKLGLTETREGEIVEVSDKVATELLSRGWAGPVTGSPAGPPQPPIKQRQATAAPAGVPIAVTGTVDMQSKDDADDSTISETNAGEAIEAIGRLRNADRLRHVVANDKRPAVQDAARKRLAAL